MQQIDLSLDSLEENPLLRISHVLYINIRDSRLYRILNQIFPEFAHDSPNLKLCQKEEEFKSYTKVPYFLMMFLLYLQGSVIMFIESNTQKTFVLSRKM